MNRARLIPTALILAAGLTLAGCSSTTTERSAESATSSSSSAQAPNVVGMAGDEARDAIEDAGLEVEWDAGDDTVIMASNWTVESQSPAAGDGVNDGDTVTLTVSKPEAESAEDREAANKQFAETVEKEWLANVGHDSFTELLTDPDWPADSLTGYIASVESPSSGTVVVTVQVTEDEVTKEELEQLAMQGLNLVGYDNEDLERVEAVTADGLLRGVANRYDSPVLSK